MPTPNGVNSYFSSWHFSSNSPIIRIQESKSGYSSYMSFFSYFIQPIGICDFKFNIYSLLQYSTCVQLFNWKYQVPTLSPNNIAVVNGETTEFARVKILIVLGMGMATDMVTNIHNLGRLFWQYCPLM